MTAWIFFIFYGVIPVAAVTIPTIMRWRNMRHRNVAFTSTVSEFLVAMLCLGAALGIIEIADSGVYLNVWEWTNKSILIGGVICGLIAGKIWHLSSEKKGLHFCAVFFIAGVAIWSLAAWALIYACLILSLSAEPVRISFPH